MIKTDVRKPEMLKWKTLLTLTYMFMSMFLMTTCLITGNAAILHVAKDGDGTDGLTWATAFQSISSAIVSAISGDQIWVREGTYNEVLTLKSGLALYGGFLGTESNADITLRNWNENITIIDGNSIEKNVLTLTNLTETIVDGFTITGTRVISCFGSIWTIKNCIVENIPSGGIYCYKCATSIESCKIRKNKGAYSGITVGGSLNSNPTQIINCEVYNNSCAYQGGGILCISTKCIISNCLIYNNAITRPEGYTSSVFGGGIYAFNNTDYIKDTTVTLTHCTVANNTVATGEYSTEMISILSGSVLGGRPAPTIAVSNSIIVDPTMGFSIDTPHIGFNYTNYVPHLVSGLGNISADPQFVSTSSSDEFPYQLKASSPCIDTATGTELTNDILGASRPVDIPGVGHEGIYSADMGCYEFQLPTPTPTLTPTPMPTPTMNPKADINEDGRVDSKDLLIIESAWGTVVENK